MDQQNNLYLRSKNGETFNNIYKRIISRENIIFALRELRTNQGSKTPGIDGKTITDIENMEMDEIINRVKKSLNKYVPNKVRRVYIPKANGKKRPLGIPTIMDRLIQYCIKNVLEPICEGKFHERSYGFRPNRSCHDAIARTRQLVELGKNYICVNIDIEGFFDNVDHNILIRKMWLLGIRDKRVIAIIKRILKSEIDGEGIPDKGTPQGGIISPLLANIYLHELDEWIGSQWEDFTTEHQYSSKSKTHRALRTTRLKEVWYVRYADDFKIFCKSKEVANKIFHATTEWLQHRLKLNISEEKSCITNLTKKKAEFLGFSLKVSRRQTRNKRTDKRVFEIRISDKKLKEIQTSYKKRVQDLVYTPRILRINLLNSYIMGVQNYFSIATKVGSDLIKPYLIGYRILKRHLKSGVLETVDGKNDGNYQKRYKRYKFKKFGYQDAIIYPLPGIKCDPPKLKADGINPYEANVIKPIPDGMNGGSGTGLYYSNRYGKYYQQRGLCYITGEPLNTPHCHHIIPVKLGGGDEYSNLVIIEKYIHIEIHRGNKEIPEIMNLNSKQRKRYIELLEKANPV